MLWKRRHEWGKDPLAVARIDKPLSTAVDLVTRRAEPEEDGRAEIQLVGTLQDALAKLRHCGGSADEDCHIINYVARNSVYCLVSTTGTPLRDENRSNRWETQQFAGYMTADIVRASAGGGMAGEIGEGNSPRRPPASRVTATANFREGTGAPAGIAHHRQR